MTERTTILQGDLASALTLPSSSDITNAIENSISKNQRTKAIVPADGEGSSSNVVKSAKDFLSWEGGHGRLLPRYYKAKIKLGTLESKLVRRFVSRDLSIPPQLLKRRERLIANVANIEKRLVGRNPEGKDAG